MTKQILTSKLSMKHLNFGKNSKLHLFIDEYRNAVKFYVNYLFNNEVITSYYDKKSNSQKSIIFNIKKDLLDLPLFISNKEIPYNSILSERALKCALSQSLGIMKSLVEKRKKLLYILSTKKNKRNKRTRNRALLKKLDKTKLICPKLDKVNPEINSILANFSEENNTKFDNILILSSLGKNFGKIIIPINNTKHSNSLAEKGKRMSSILISEKYIYVRYEIELPEIKKEGEIVGLDQGIKTCLTLSDGQTSKKLDNHDLDTITNKIARKKKGSKAFHKALDHLDNYIGWAINQLDFSLIKQLNIEKVINFRHGKNVGKKLNYFRESLINELIIRRAQQQGVLVVEQSSAYRSQRCSQCGYVCKKNRKGKEFCCRHCSFQADADCNASCNHRINLPTIKHSKMHPLDNKKGFFWKEEGLFNLKGEEITVPLTIKDSY